jgi:hypothetical protein
LALLPFFSCSGICIPSLAQTQCLTWYATSRSSSPYYSPLFDKAAPSRLNIHTASGNGGTKHNCACLFAAATCYSDEETSQI